jgi:hypothetical protein
MTSGGDASVSRMLDNYRELIRRFVIGDSSADEFEKEYLARFKDDPNQVIGEEFGIPLHGASNRPRRRARILGLLNIAGPDLRYLIPGAKPIRALSLLAASVTAAPNPASDSSVRRVIGMFTLRVAIGFS